MNAMSIISEPPTTWEQCHAAGMTAKEAAAAMGRSANAAYDWATRECVSFAKDPGRSEMRVADFPPLPELTADNVRATDCRRLFVNVAAAALCDLRARIAAAREGKTRKSMTTGQTVPIHRLDVEIIEAMRYLASLDFRLVCECAGIEHEPEAAMAWVLGEVDTPKGVTGRRYFTHAAPSRVG